MPKFESPGFDATREYGTAIPLTYPTTGGFIYHAIIYLFDNAAQILPVGTWFYLRAGLSKPPAFELTRQYHLHVAWHYTPAVPSIVKPVRLRDFSTLDPDKPGQVMGTAKLVHKTPILVRWTWDPTP